MGSGLDGVRAAVADLPVDLDDPHFELAAEVALLAAMLIRVDNVVLPEEHAALCSGLSEHLGLAPEVAGAVTEHVLGLEDAAVPDKRAVLAQTAARERTEKLIVVDALLGICAADGSLHPWEQTALQVLVRDLGVPASSYRELMSKWDPRGSPGTRHTLLGQNGLSLGSSSRNTLRLAGLTVSRHHAAIRPEDGGWVLHDLGSTNGTWVNGERISRHRLAPGDLIRIEQYRLRVDPARGALWVWDSGDFLSLAAEGLTVDVPDRHRRGATRRILDDASLHIHSGELVALMGPSGCGKTTLINALLGLVPAAGEVRLNRERCALIREQASRVGVVPQDDIVYSRLTVEESLRYSARLRSVPGVPDDRIEEAVDRVIEQLGLAHIRHAVIGDPVRRGISGGERKRVNLGQELLNPGTRILVLDEPTTGLDPHTGDEIMRLLRSLADQGRIVIAVTHQVDDALFALADKVLILGAGGHTAYFGPAREALSYFEVDGVPAMFARLGDVEQARALAERYRGSIHHERHVVLPRRLHERPETMGRERDPAAAKGAGKARSGDPQMEEIWERVEAAFGGESPEDELQQTAGRTLQATHAPAMMQDPTGPPSTHRLGDRLRGGLRQWLTLTARYARVKLRDRAALWVALGQIPLIVAGCWVVLADTLQYHDGRLDQDFLTVPGSLPFVLVVSAFWFGCVNAVREVVADQAIYRRERHAGVLPGGYLGSKVAVLFTLTAAQCALLLLAAHVLFGLGARHVDPLRAVAVLVLVGLFGTALGLLVSAAFRSAEAAVSVLPALVIPQLLFGGLLVPLDRMWAPLRWASSVMASRWGMAGLLQAGDPAVGGGGVASVTECTQYSPPSGDSGACVHGFLEELGFAHREAVEGTLIATRTVVDGTYGEACAWLGGLTLLAVVVTWGLLRGRGA